MTESIAPPRRGWQWVMWVVGTAAVAVTIAISVRWGRSLQRTSPEIFLGAAPLVGRNFRDGWDWRFGWGLIGAGGVAGLVIGGVWTDWWWRARLRWVVATSTAGATLFATALALTDGVDGIVYGVEHESEYLANLAITPPAASFVRHFVDDIDRYSVHVRGHPPGYTLVLKVFDAIGLGGTWPVAVLQIVAVGVTSAGVLVAVWAFAGPGWMRRTAPMLVVAPYALWMVSSADAVYSAVGACGVAACAMGQRSVRWSAVGWGLIGGTLLAALLFLTYGGAMFLLVPAVPLVAALVRRHVGAWRTVAAATVAATAVTLAFAAAGFWWFDGVAVTRREYWEGTAQFRPLGYFAIANLAAACIAVGPATLAGLPVTWRTRREWPWAALLVLGGVAALLAAHASQYTRAEVERIWLLFFPWIAIAGASLVRRDRRAGACLAVASQAACAIVLQAALVSKW